MDKNHPGQNLPDKRPPDKTPGQTPPRTIEREFVQGAFVRVFCTRRTKNRGGPRCVTYFGGKPLSGQPAVKIEAKPNLSRNLGKPAEKLSGGRLVDTVNV